MGSFATLSVSKLQSEVHVLPLTPRFSKSYDSDQEIITEQFLPARIIVLFKDENAPEWLMVTTRRNKNVQNMFSNNTIEKRLSSMYTPWHYCTVNIFRKSSLAWHIFTGCFYRCLKHKTKKHVILATHVHQRNIPVGTYSTLLLSCTSRIFVSEWLQLGPRGQRVNLSDNWNGRNKSHLSGKI